MILFEPPSHFTPSLDLKSSRQMQRHGELKTSTLRKGNRKAAGGEGKQAVSGPTYLLTIRMGGGSDAGVQIQLVPGICWEHS